MSKILLLVRNLAVDHEPVQYALRIARASGAEVECLRLTFRDPSTAEWLKSRPQRAIQRLRRIRARQTTAEWVDTLEQLKKKERKRFGRHQTEVKERFEKEGISCSCSEVRLDSGGFLNELEKRMPVGLIVGERVRFPPELAHQGIMTISDLGERYHCTAIDGTIMHRLLRPVPRSTWRQLAIYGPLALLVYVGIFPRIEDLNRFLMAGGVLPAVGIMAAAAAVAWVYGKTVESLLRLTKLDVY